MMQEPVILAVETSSRVGSVALGEGTRLLGETTFSGPLRHSAELFPAIGELLRRFEKSTGSIAEVYLTTGPGSFTGLRIAVAMAKAMHLANAVRIVTVDSLDVIAANMTDGPDGAMIQNGSTRPPLDFIATVLDAKRGQFYAAVYERASSPTTKTDADPAEPEGYAIPAPDEHAWRKIVPASLMTADELLHRCTCLAPLGVLGDGLLYHQDAFRAAGTRVLNASYWSPRAANVYMLGYQKARAGLFTNPVSLTPFYLRAPLVTVKKHR
jgi:tRNA threonylcarbamoyladenosine biosynthesis protein TsaB